MRYFLAVCCALAVLSVQVLYGGAMRPVFAMPGYLILGLVGALGLLAIFWRNIPSASVSCLASVFGLAGWLIWREFGSPDPWLAQVYLRLTVACLVMYLLFACVITNPYHRLAFICVLFLAAVVQSAGAGWQFTKRQAAGPMIPWLSEQLRLWYSGANWRGHGTYLNGNHLAWFLNAIGLSALAVTCWGRWGLKTKIVCVYVALASFAGSVVTLSRGGFLGLGAGLMVFLLLSALVLAIGVRHQRFVTVLIVAAVVVGVGCIVFAVFRSSLVVQDRFDRLVSDPYRPAIFEAALRQAQLNPVFGTGAGTFLYYGRLYREPIGFNDDIYAHNDWMQLVGDFGVPAFALAAWVVVAHGLSGMSGLVYILRRRMQEYSRPQSHAAAILIAALATLAVFAVHSFFDFNMQIPANALLASAFVGMLANPGSGQEGRRNVFGTVFRKFGCVAGFGCALWLSLLAWKGAAGEFFWLQAENALLQGDLTAAKSLAETGLAQGDHNRLRRILGETYLKAAHQSQRGPDRAHWAKKAAVEFETAAERLPIDGRNLILAAEARKLAGQNRASAFLIVDAIAYAPTLGSSYQFYARLLEEEGRLREAKQAYLVAAFLPGQVAAWKRAWELDEKLRILNR